MNLPTLHNPTAQVPGFPGYAGPYGPQPGMAQPAPAMPFVGTVSAEQKLELLEYWRSITKRKWALLALSLAVAVLAAVVSMSMTPIYRASATVLIEAGKGKTTSIEEVYSINQQREHYQTQVEILKSRDVALRTVKAMQLWNHPEFDPRLVKPTWTQRALASVGISDDVDTKKTWTEDELAARVVRKFQTSLITTPVRLSQLVKIEFESSDPELAAKVVNTTAAQYIASDRDERYRLTTQVSQQLQDRLVSLRQNLEKSEKALQDYREKKGLVSLKGDAQTNTAQQLGSMTERMLAARAKRMELEGQYAQVKNSAGSGYGSAPAVVRDTGVSDAQRLVSAAAAKVAELESRLGPAHDQMKQARAELAEVTALLQQRQSAVAQSVMREYEAARSTELALERSMDSVRGAAQGVNRDEFQLGVLEREYQSNRQLFDMFLNRAKETSLIGDVQPSVARIADAAVPPETPVKPKRSQIVLVSALLALLLGALACVAMDRMDNTIKGSDDAEKRLRSPVLAALPEVEQATRKMMARAFLQDNHSQFAEGIRTARTGILLSGLDTNSKVLLITSSLPGEGKSTVAVNLAFAHAQSNTRTLLIDCDMRRGQASRMLGQGSAKLGLTTLVSGRATAEECILPVKQTGLSILPVGDTPPNPLELLHSQKFKDTLAALSKEFPMIIIDSPPVELVSEALVLAPLATQVVVVVRAMSTPAPLVRKTQLRLQRAGGQLLGVIINGLNFKEARTYYGEYAHSSYSYAYDNASAANPGSSGFMQSLKGRLPWKRSKPVDEAMSQYEKAA